MTNQSQELPQRSEHCYQTRDLTRALGVSRASLMYYEQAGLVSPVKDPETGVRGYSTDDVFNLFAFKALGNLGLTTRQVASEADRGPNLFDERRLESYLALTQNKIAHYEALRSAIDRMRAVRVRERFGPELLVEYIERHIFAQDGAENGYLEFKASDDLDFLVACLPISGFGIMFDLNDQGETVWRWGRTVPTAFAAVAGIRQHFPLQVGGCECVTMIGRILDAETPLPPDAFGPLYQEAKRLGRKPAGKPFVPYIFPPHAGTPFKLCLPLE